MAAPLVFWLPFLLLAQVASEEAKQLCSLSGTVFDQATGQPLSKVSLRLEPVDGRERLVAATRTDASGRFAFVQLESGAFRLKAKRPGYLETYHRTLLRLEPGQALKQVALKLGRAGIIAGTVRDSDGEPLEGAHIVLGRFTYEYGKGRVEGFDSTDTDDRGEYRFRGLTEGRYYVAVEPLEDGSNLADRSARPEPEASVATLYQGVRDIRSATAIELPAGQERSNIDVTLVRSRVFRVSGQVVNAPASGRLEVTLRDKQNAGMRNGGLRTPTINASGAFEFRGVPPGSYEAVVRHQSEWAKAMIEVGANLEGVRLTLSPGAEIKFNIVTDTEEKQPGWPGLEYLLTADGRSGFTALPNQTDRLTARSVPPDHYSLSLSGPLLRRFYVRSVRSGDVDVLSDGLEVTGPGKVTINVVLGSDGARLKGFARNKEGQPTAGATVVLAPISGSAPPDRLKSTTTDQNGHYEFAAIPPGAYLVLASDDVRPVEWQDPGFVKRRQRQAKKVELGLRAAETVDLLAATGPDEP